MKVLNINTSDILGGASRAVYRLHQGLKLIDVNSQMFVQSKSSDDFTVSGNKTKLEKAFGKVKPTLDTFPLNFYKEREKTVFSTQWLPSNIHTRINQLNPDVVNLHWICGGFIPIETLAKIKVPLVWTLHDMWAFTGGCHYAGDCEGYLNNCGNCPQLNSNQSWDLSRWIWQRKSKSWNSVKLTIVTPSQWLADCAKKSSLFKNYRVEVIPYGLDINIYKPIDKQFARNLLNLPQDKKLILFGAMSGTSNQRKGFQFLSPALEKLALKNHTNDFELVVFGASQPAQDPNLPFKTNYLGRLNDDVSIALLYSAVDVFVAPSVEDNLPNTVMESLACGTPTVAFKIGGMPDMIEHQVNGYLAQPFEIGDLTQGISWILKENQNYHKLSENARKTVEEKFTLKLQARRYLELYRGSN
ncbi:glycosyltransferase family 4 protein [Geminocystis sp. CENA526]|uniref:glycosyltransferase family 4 protein n=1 Tax=Geminocystis sp. CENA526 TaxID=1355871 RepID=UPI003D6E43CB